jgi:NAD(P)-dependent dehydrogenase (short-subunit alcohol dehydrogenase family)
MTSNSGASRGAEQGLPDGWSLGAGLDGKVAVVTGAASGIGRSASLQLAAAGARVAAVDIDLARLEGTLAEMAGDGHIAVQQDLRRIPELTPMLHDVASRLGRLDVMMNVAAALRRQNLEDVTEEDWDFQHDVNLKATFFLCRTAGQIMATRGEGGRIINFTSGSWQVGTVGGQSDAYVASKGGVVSMTRSFAKQFGRHGITVNVVSPGQIDTPMQHVDNTPEEVERSMRACPLGRMGEPREVAAAAVFLASSHASFISGATITVSGASVMW